MPLHLHRHLVVVALTAIALPACVETVDDREPTAKVFAVPPIQEIDFVARHGGTCNVAGPGLAPGGNPTWYPITTEVPVCPGGAADCLQQVMLDPVAFPAARCNDGSTAIMYVRVNPASHRWIIHLQKGGGCTDYDSCYQRWCGLGSYSAGKMSSFNQPDEMAAQGIFSDRVGNPFRDWNVVYGFYCSSDSWRGAAGTVAFSKLLPGAPAQVVRMSVEFHGAAIADAIIATLKTGAVVTTAGGEQLDLPDLDQATTVLFSGGSAGGVGVRHLVDKIAADLRTTNPGVDVRAVIDSTHKPMEAWASNTLDGTCDASAADPYTSVADYETKSQAADALQGAVVDASCLAAHAADPQRCASDEHVLHFHVTTPFFARQGLLEKLGDDEGDGHADVSLAAWKAADREVITTYDDLGRADPITGEVREPVAGEVGWFAPDCRSHTAIDEEGFYDEKVNLVLGGTDDYVTMLDHWVTGVGRHKAYQRDDVAPVRPLDRYARRSVCLHEPTDDPAVCTP